MTIRKFAILATAAALLSGCATEEGTYVTGKTAPYEKPAPEAVARTPDQIELFSGAPNRSFTEIKPIEVAVNKITAFHPSPTVEQAQKALRAEAASLGADAVINVTISDVGVSLISWGTRYAKGTAIKY
ncbi:MAG: hypothetical protein GYB25_01545 [Rhodobacteraceae bacterium]|nr:hypothetical protein [Paracoccaceae bacterium]